ncbi:MAG: hypothetical protein KH230_09750 [Enterocloster asparagiformis]|nr:hypothetical protein [Enterocloster asparagiformis]
MIAYDMFNDVLQINDEVRFIIDHDEYVGTINHISDNFLKVNSLKGEYRRKASNVVKVKKG